MLETKHFSAVESSHLLCFFVDVKPTIMASAGEDGFDFGFNMQNVQRNAFLNQAGLKTPKAMSTGTTIVGLVYKGGVILGADTRCVANSFALRQGATTSKFCPAEAALSSALPLFPAASRNHPLDDTPFDTTYIS